MAVTIDTGDVVDDLIDSLMDRTGQKTKKGVIVQGLEVLRDKLDTRDARKSWRGSEPPEPA